MALNPKQREFVAAYIGAARKNATEAARMAGYKQPGMHGNRLIQKDEIQVAIEEHLTEVKRFGIASAQNRVDELVERHRALKQVVAERAASSHLADVPGGSTGYVVKQLKSLKHVYERDPDDPDSEAYQTTVEVWESAVDTGLLKELREHEKQAAQELGEWTERKEFVGDPERPLVVRSVSVPLPASEVEDE